MSSGHWYYIPHVSQKKMLQCEVILATTVSIVLSINTEPILSINIEPMSIAGIA